MSDILHIIWPDNAIVRVVIGLLLAAFFAAVAVALRMGSRIKSERARVKQLHAQPFMLDNASALQVIRASVPKTLAERLIQGMVLHRGLANARSNDVLDPLADEAALIPQVLKPVPNWLLLGGLIGTVVGLAYTLAGLGPQIQGALEAANPLQVATSLGLTLKQMQGAFAGTFWGVMTSLFLQFVIAAVAAQADRLITELEGYAAHISPTIYPAGTEQHLASLQQMLDEGRRFYEDTQNRVRETSEKFERVLTQASDLIASSLKTLETTSNSIGQSLLKASGDVQRSSQELTKAAKSLDTYQVELRNTYSLFNDMFETSMTHLKTHADAEVKEIRDLQQKFGDAGSTIVAELFKTSERLHTVSQELQGGTNAYIAGTESVHTSLKAGFDHLGNALHGVLDTYTDEVNAVSSRMDSLGARLEANTQASKGMEKTLRDKDSAELTRHRDQLTALKVLSDTQGILAQALSALQPSFAATQALPECLTAVAGDLRDEVARGTTQLLEGFLQASTRGEQAIQTVVVEQRGLRAQLNAQTTALEKQWGASLEALQEVAKEIERSEARGERTQLLQQFGQLTALMHDLRALLSAQPTAEHAERVLQQQAALRREIAALTIVDAPHSTQELQTADQDEARSA